MESKKDKTVKLKSSLSQTRKIIAEKFRKLHKNNISTERKLRKKYAPLTDSVKSLNDTLKQKVISNNDEQKQQQQNDVREEEEDIDDDYVEMPPPPYPPPPLPP